MSSTARYILFCPQGDLSAEAIERVRETVPIQILEIIDRRTLLFTAAPGVLDLLRESFPTCRLHQEITYGLPRSTDPPDSGI